MRLPEPLSLLCVVPQRSDREALGFLNLAFIFVDFPVLLPVLPCFEDGRPMIEEWCVLLPDTAVRRDELRERGTRDNRCEELPLFFRWPPFGGIRGSVALLSRWPPELPEPFLNGNVRIEDVGERSFTVRRGLFPTEALLPTGSCLTFLEDGLLASDARRWSRMLLLAELPEWGLLTLAGWLGLIGRLRSDLGGSSPGCTLTGVSPERSRRSGVVPRSFSSSSSCAIEESSSRRDPVRLTPLTSMSAEPVNFLGRLTGLGESSSWFARSLEWALEWVSDALSFMREP